MMKCLLYMKKTNLYVKLTVSLFLLLGILHVSVSADDAIPTNGARVLFDSWDYEINNGAFIEKRHFQKVIYNKLGEQYNRVFLHEDDFSKVSEANLIVYSAEGKELFKKEKKHFNKQCGYGSFGGYDDDCIYYFDAEAVQFPYTIDFSYTKKCVSLFYLNGATFQRDIPVDSVSFTIHNYDKTAIQSKLYGSNQSPLISNSDNEVTYQWILTKIPALERVKYLPAGARKEIELNLVCENLTLDGYTLPEISWSGIGQWYNELYDGKCNTAPLQDSLSMEDIYNRVIDNVRYVAIEVGIGGWQPYDAVLTESREYGDCKDMSTLLISRLKNQNYTAFPVLVLTRDAGRIDKDFPNLSFNHVITVAINGSDTIWMDPTCNSCTMGELPSGDEDIDVLVVTPEGGVIRRTPSSKSKDNRLLRNTTLQISPDRLVSISSVSTIYGDYAREMRNAVIDVSDDDIKGFLERYLNRKETLFKLESYSFENIDDITKPVVLHLQASMIKPLDKISNKWYINPFLFFREKNMTKVATAKREFPINLGYPFEVLDSVQIKLDSSIVVDSIISLPSDTIDTPFLSFSTNLTSDKNKFVSEISFQQKTYQLNPENFLEYEIFYKRLKKVTSKYFKLYSR